MWSTILGGGVKHVLFSEDETIFDEHTFHMGWNHQAVTSLNFWELHTLVDQIKSKLLIGPLTEWVKIVNKGATIGTLSR